MSYWCKSWNMMNWNMMNWNMLDCYMMSNWYMMVGGFKRWYNSSHWWSASMYFSNWVSNAFLVSSYLIKNSSSSIELNSHCFVGINEGLEFSWDWSILSTKNTVVTFHGCNLSLQVWVVVKEAPVWWFASLWLVSHADNSTLHSIASDSKIIDVSWNLTVSDAGFMDLIGEFLVRCDNCFNCDSHGINPTCDFSNLDN